MPRELRIAISIPIPPGDIFEEAAAIAAAGEVVNKLKTDVAELGHDATVEFDVVTPKPRTAKEDKEAGTPAQPTLSAIPAPASAHKAA